MSEILDRVATAIRNGDFGDDAYWREKAALAVKAMRIPTWEMKIAGRDMLCDTLDEDAGVDDAHSAYRAMIEAALK